MSTHTLTLNWTDGVNSIQQTVAKTASGDQKINEDIADSETDFPIAFALDVSAAEMIYILSDQDITLETNSGSEADDTLALKAGEPVHYWKGGPIANPFASEVDVTGLYITNASGSTANLQMVALYDATP